MLIQVAANHHQAIAPKRVIEVIDLRQQMLSKEKIYIVEAMNHHQVIAPKKSILTVQVINLQRIIAQFLI